MNRVVLCRKRPAENAVQVVLLFYSMQCTTHLSTRLTLPHFSRLFVMVQMEQLQSLSGISGVDYVTLAQQEYEQSLPRRSRRRG